MRAAALAALLVGLQAQLDLDCARPHAAALLIGQARLSEIELAEDVHGHALREALGECQPRPDRGRCEAARREEFTAAFALTRAAIEDKYRRMLETFETRCRASLA